MKHNSLSRLLTLVLMGCFFCGIGWAEEKEPVRSSKDIQNPETRKQFERNMNEELKLKVELLGLEKAAKNRDLGSMAACRAHIASLNKAKESYQKSCAIATPTFKIFDAALKAKPGDSPEFQCAVQLERCSQCALGTTKLSIMAREVDCGTLEDEQDLEDESPPAVADLAKALGGMSKDPKAEKELRTEKAELFSCLPDAGGDYEERKRDLKESKRDLRRLEESVRERESKLYDLQLKMTESQNTYQDQADELQTKGKETVDKIQEARTESDDKLTQVISQLQQNLDGLSADIMRIDRQRDQASAAYADNIGQLDRQCHATALARVQEYQKQVYDLMSRSEYSLGDFNSVMQGGGSSSRQRFQQLANQYYNDCKADEAYKTSKSSTARALDNAMKIANGESDVLRKKQQAISNQIVQLQTTAKSQSIQRATTDLQKVQDQISKGIQRMDRDSRTSAAKNMQNMMLKTSELTSDKAQLAEAQIAYSSDSQMTKLLSRAGRKVKGDARTELQSSYTALRSAAMDAVAACCNKSVNLSGEVKVTPEDAADAQKYCDAACKPYEVGDSGMFFCTGTEPARKFADPNSKETSH